METQGRKEVAEAVTIAALSALATAVINYGVERVKARETARKQKQTDAERIQALENELAQMKSAKPSAEE